MRLIRGVLPAAAIYLSLSVASVAHSQDSLLKSEIEAAHPVAKNGQEFIMHTRVRNVSGEDRLFEFSTCSYPEQWIADDSQVHIRTVHCKENPVEEMNLKPGEAYRQALHVRISIPEGTVPLGKYTFRLGFMPERPMLIVCHNNDECGKPTAGVPQSEKERIWSNPLTVIVTE